MFWTAVYILPHERKNAKNMTFSLNCYSKLSLSCLVKFRGFNILSTHLHTFSYFILVFISYFFTTYPTRLAVWLLFCKRREAGITLGYEDWWVSEPLFSLWTWSPYMISWVAHALAFVLYFIKLQLWYQLRLGTSCWYTELLVISRLVQMLGVKKSIRSTSYSWNRLQWGYLDCSIQTATCSHPLSMNAYLLFFLFLLFLW